MTTPAITSIYGLMTHNSSVVISGSNFGSKPNAVKPVIWDDFEDGDALDLDCSTLSRESWDSVGTADSSATEKHSGSYGITKTPVYEIQKTLDNIGNGGRIYCNFWKRYTSTLRGIASLNAKFIRNTGEGNAYPRMVFAFHGTDLGGEYCVFVVEGPPDGTPLYDTVTFLSGDIPDTAWYNWEFIFQLSSGASEADGIVRVLRGCVQKANWTDVVTHSASIYPNEWKFATDMEGYSGGQSYDDIYLDDSWARVVIGDNATYANCTHREMQIPTAWATGEITVSVNRGSFGTSDPAYLFVIDSDGNVNADGYAIQFGESYGESSESPSSSPSLSPSSSLSPSNSPSLSPSASESPSKSPSLSPSESPSASPSLSPSASLSPSRSPSMSASASPSMSPSEGSQYPCFVLAASPNIVANGADTTGQLTAPATKVVETDFQAGRIQDDENPCDSINLASGKYTEIEWCIMATEFAENVTYEFRVTRT